MSDQPIILPELDEPPAQWVDVEGPPVTDAEAAEGEDLRHHIDVDDDEDNGL